MENKIKKQTIGDVKIMLEQCEKFGLFKVNSKKKEFFYYSICFFFVALIVYSSFLIFEKSFVWNNDGMSQHYPALAYFGWWCREIIKNLLHGNFVVPVWDFSIGYGSDIITTFHYYGFGDPLSLLSVIVPTKYTEYLYDFLVILRLYLSGWFFVLFCKKMKQDVRVSILGAIIYSFSGYALYAGVKHPFFLTPMVYLPLLLLGTEKIFSKEKPTLFIVSVALATLSNFYFSFMLIICVVIYVVVRCFSSSNKKSWQDFMYNLLKFAVFGVVGILISCVILLPIIMVYLNNSRVGETAVSLLYPLSYYEKLFAGFLGNTNAGYWNLTGYSPLALLSVFYIFSKKKQYGILKTFFIICCVLQLIPVFGFVFCGMTYVSNRWLWAFSFLLAYITVCTFKNIISATLKENKKIIIFSYIYIAITLILPRGASESSLSGIILFAVMLIVILVYNDILIQNKKRICAIALSLLCVFSISLNSCYWFSPIFGGSFIYEFLDSSKVLAQSDSSSASIFKDDIKQNSQINRFDYNKNVFGHNNQALLTHTNSLSYYWSFNEATISSFMDEMELNNTTAYLYNNLNHRTFLNSLASVGYYIEGKLGQRPYGYKQIKSKTVNDEKYSLYKNNKALSIGYTYDRYITRDEYNRLSPVEKQEALMQNVLLEKQLSNYKKNDYYITNFQIPYEITYNDGGIATKNGVYVTKANASLKLNFDRKENSETYIRFTNMSGKYLDNYELREALPEKYEKEILTEPAINKQMRSHSHLYKSKVNNFKIYFNNGASTSSFTLTNPGYEFHNGKKNITINLGYSEKGKDYCYVTFPTTGFYSWDEIQIISQPMYNYDQYISTLSKDELKNVEIADNSVSGTINVEKQKILCLSIPYTKGWTAYVDGVETELLRANTWCMALDLGAGEHTIELHYKTPGLTLGMAATGIGLVLLGAVALLYKRKKRTTIES